MRKTMTKTAAFALAGVMAAGMLTGCGAKELDGTKTVATVNGTQIPLGIVSLYARQQQAQTAAMYMSFMGSAANIWDQEGNAETGETYGEMAVKDCLKEIEIMYLLKEKAADYGVEVTDEDEKAMAEAAAAFISDNDEETLKELAVNEEMAKTFLELRTYNNRLYDPIIAEANVEITDDEANQSAFTYVNISTTTEGLTDEDKAKRKEQAEEILAKVKEDPAADMSEIAKAVDETYTSLSGTFTTKASDDVTDSYPAEVMEVLRTLKEGEVGAEVIETESGYYVVRLDKELDEEATESRRNSLKETKEREYYKETTEKWLEEADVKTEDKVLETLTVTDSHSFTFKPAEPVETPDAEEENEAADEADEAEMEEAADTEDAENTEDTENTEE